MSEKILVKGNEAFGEAAIRAGCRYYFGYPITPQNELIEYMSRRLPEVGGKFLQAESEVSVVNMLYGASCMGVRVMTSTSSPGFSLMQEGVSYIAGAELPAVFINVVRGGPGLGDIQPAQGDYLQATKGGGHGDYRLIVLGPSTIQEAIKLVILAFDLADKYRTPVEILADGMIGQMMEPVELPEMRPLDALPKKPWALTGAKGRKPNKITSFDLDPYNLEKMNLRYQATREKIITNEQRCEEVNIEGADILVVAYGTVGRIMKTVIELAEEKSMKVGLFRPITLWPFPYKQLEEISKKVSTVLTVELSGGQMLEDVKLAVKDNANTPFYGRMGGVIPTPEEILGQIEKLVKKRREV
ncbi:3-methyl-2-oxobutanoate dehydrogenase subunit VorB [Candidatus Aerophobetes bacterium]|nr:3-methyl-2-oxobutanoate dehydrogenase subunit VorB [Candidatus Aerophobetes bacterium]